MDYDYRRSQPFNSIVLICLYLALWNGCSDDKTDQSLTSSIPELPEIYREPASAGESRMTTMMDDEPDRVDTGPAACEDPQGHIISQTSQQSWTAPVAQSIL